MSNHLLELAIKLYESEINQYLYFDEIREVYQKQYIDLPERCWASTTMEVFWFRFNKEKYDKKVRIYIKITGELCIEVNHLLKEDLTSRYAMKLQIEDIFDIQSNFMIDGKLDSTSFMLAYGRGYRDELFDFNQSDYNIFSKFLTPVMEGILK